MTLETHTSEQFNQDFSLLCNMLEEMGVLVREQLEKSVMALIHRDISSVDLILSIGEKVNSFQKEIDQKCVEIIVRRQPAAVDLRVLISIIRLISDLERIGDESEKVAKIVRELENTSHDHESITLIESANLKMIGNIVLDALTRAINAFLAFDKSGMSHFFREDRIIDKTYSEIKKNCISLMKTSPERAEDIMNIIWVARSLERIGDHIINICESVVYSIDGDDIRYLK